MDDNTTFVDPDETLREPKRRGRPRKILDALSSEPVEDNASTDATPKKERKPRTRKRSSYVGEIESLLVGCFQLSAIRLGPVMEIPSPIGDEETQKKEKDAIHKAAIYFDKWQMGLAPDSPFVKLVDSVSEVSPLVIAFGALGQIAYIKYQMMVYVQMTNAAMQEEMRRAA